MSARDHLARLHELPCPVCEQMGVLQQSRTVAHHVESVRDKNSDYAAVAICDHHHKLLHQYSRRWFQMQFKLTDIDLLALTIKAMDKAGMLHG